MRLLPDFDLACAWSIRQLPDFDQAAVWSIRLPPDFDLACAWAIRNSLISGWEVAPDLPEQHIWSCSKNQASSQTSLICEKSRVSIMVLKIHFYLKNFFRAHVLLKCHPIYLNITSLTAEQCKFQNQALPDIRRLPNWSGTCKIKIRPQPDQSGCCLIKIRQLPNQSGACQIKIRRQPDRSGCCLIKIRQVPDRSGTCQIKIRWQPDLSGCCLIKIRQLPDRSGTWFVRSLLRRWTNNANIQPWECMKIEKPGVDRPLLGPLNI